MISKNILILIYVTSLCIFICNCLPKWTTDDKSCHSEDDCPTDYCCAIGFTRYSVPQCMPLGQIGHWCREYNEPQNKSLAFPNGQYLEFSQIYTQFCPCDSGLVCERAKCVTQVNEIDFDSFVDHYLDIDY